MAFIAVNTPTKSNGLGAGTSAIEPLASIVGHWVASEHITTVDLCEAP